MRPAILICVLFFVGCHTSPRRTSPIVSQLKTDRFGIIQTVAPGDDISGVVLWFRGNNELNGPERLRRDLFVRNGFAVAEVSSAPYLDALREGGDECLQFGEIVRLGQVVQNALQLPRLFNPVLAGNAGGEAIAYLTAASDPNNFSGIAIEDGCAQLERVPDTCDDDVPVEYNKKTRTVVFSENPSLTLPTFYLEAVTPACGVGTHRYSEILPAVSPKNDGSSQEQADHGGVPALDDFLSAAKAERPEAPEPKSEFGLVELPAADPIGRPLLLFLSGDGGWATIDRDLGGYFRDHGINVLGLSSLSFFWKERSAQELADALEVIVEEYAARWSTHEIYLGGFSLGADVLPSGFNRLPEKVRRRINRLLLVSPGTSISFEVHLTDWLNISDESGIDALPEALKASIGIICVYGEEDESICPKLSRPTDTTIRLSGGHHFDGDYDALGERILQVLAPKGGRP